jgi:hypothetical protein
MVEVDSGRLVWTVVVDFMGVRILFCSREEIVPDEAVLLRAFSTNIRCPYLSLLGLFMWGAL